MNKGLMLAAFAVLLLGSAFAMENASVQGGVDQGQYSFVSGAMNVTTEGGNVTEVNVSSNASTERWVGFYGNVTGNLLLSKGVGQALYTWTWYPTGEGEVCVSLNSAFSGWSTLTGATAATMDTLFGFASGPDKVMDTFGSNPCSMTFTAMGVAQPTGIGNKTNDNTGAAYWETCAFDGGAETVQEDYVFCVNMSTGHSVAPSAMGYNYQLMAPINDSLLYTDEYFFYVELE